MSEVTIPPADIIAQLLQDLDLVGAYSLFVSSLPDEEGNNEAIAVFDTTAMDDGKLARGNVRIEHPGFEIMLRSMVYRTGYMKMRQIALALDQAVRQVVTVDGVNYLVHNIKRTTSVIYIGMEEKNRRRLFSVNAIFTVSEV